MGRAHLQAIHMYVYLIFQWFIQLVKLIIYSDVKYLVLVADSEFMVLHLVPLLV